MDGATTAHQRPINVHPIAGRFARYSADAILHRCRWHWQVERGDRGFKINNNWSAPLARWFLKIHPEAAGFFELRERVDA